MIRMVPWVVVLLCITRVVCLDCDQTLQPQFASENADVTIQFTIDVSTISSYAYLIVALNNNTSILGITYAAGQINIDDALPDVSFTGDANNGRIAFNIDNIGTTRAGTCTIKLFGTTQVLQCVSVYILGKPIVQLEQISQDPPVDGNVTVRCSGTSTTFPADPGLGMRYNWTFSGAEIIGDRFHIFDNKMTISRISKADQGKSVSCTATENVTEGLTSDRSDDINLIVTYGPENIRFNPPTTRYRNMSGNSLPNIICVADCNPSCNYHWHKDDDTTLIQSGHILSLRELQPSKSGNYTCTAARNGHIETKHLVVDVIFGPLNISLSTNGHLYRQDENKTLGPIVCDSYCWQCGYQWTGPQLQSLTSGPILTVPTLHRNQSGIYNCTATNKYSQKSRTVTISVEVRCIPRPPVYFRLLDVMKNTARFVWVRGFNGGHKQTFLIQLSEDGQNSWSNETFVDENDVYSNLGNKTYIANITDLKPGSYRVQLVAINAIGSTEPLSLSKVIEITSSEKQNEDASLIGPGIGGGVGAALLIVALVALIIFLRRRNLTGRSTALAELVH